MKAGFTLVEVMVAVAVASLLIVGVTASTQGAVRTVERQKADARAEEQRARAIELLRQDWRGRVRLVQSPIPDPAGTRTLRFSTTADSISGSRGSRLVTYAVTEKGLSRREGDVEALLLPGPLQLDYWDGVAWRADAAGRQPALRLRLQNPEESVVVR